MTLWNIQASEKWLGWLGEGCGTGCRTQVGLLETIRDISGGKPSMIPSTVS